LWINSTTTQNAPGTPLKIPFDKIYLSGIKPPLFALSWPVELKL